MLSLRSLWRLAWLGALLIGLAGCAASYRNHGYLPSEEDLAGLTIGVDTKDTVAEAVGTPTAGGVLSDGGFYYVRTRVRNFAYQAPKVVDRQLVAISFDPAGRVSNIERFGLEDGREVVLTRRVTDSSASDRIFIRQLLRGLGRFRPAGLAPS